MDLTNKSWWNKLWDKVFVGLMCSLLTIMLIGVAWSLVYTLFFDKPDRRYIAGYDVEVIREHDGSIHKKIVKMDYRKITVCVIPYLTEITEDQKRKLDLVIGDRGTVEIINHDGGSCQLLISLKEMTTPCQAKALAEEILSVFEDYDWKGGFLAEDGEYSISCTQKE